MGAPGALYALLLGRFITTSYPIACTFSISYGAKAQDAAGRAGDPGKAPA